MSDVAASGGYYIACQADTIVASEGTITGSIGVIWIRLNMSQLLGRFGFNTEWLKKGKRSDMATGGRLLNDDEKKQIQNSINNMYTVFKDKVKNGRENILLEDNLDQVAMGRVFTGKRAQSDVSLPLVDITGSFNDAIEIAKKSAGLAEDDEIEIVEYPQSNKSFFSFLGKNEASLDHIQLLKEILPKEIADQIDVLDIATVIMDDEIQMILPYQITID